MVFSIIIWFCNHHLYLALNISITPRRKLELISSQSQFPLSLIPWQPLICFLLSGFGSGRHFIQKESCDVWPLCVCLPSLIVPLPGSCMLWHVMRSAVLLFPPIPVGKTGLGCPQKSPSSCLYSNFTSCPISPPATSLHRAVLGTARGHWVPSGHLVNPFLISKMRKPGSEGLTCL